MIKKLSYFCGLLVFSLVLGLYLSPTLRSAIGDLDAIENVDGTAVFRIDSDGHVKPGVDDTHDLGTSALEWRNLRVDGTANIDTLNVNNITIHTASATVSLAATGTTYTPTHSYTIVESTAGITINTVPLISTSAFTAGTELMLRNGGSNTFAIQDDGGLAGSGFSLGTATRTLDTNDVITFVLDDETNATWVETSFVNNQ